MAVTDAQLRDALAWEGGSVPPDDKSTWEWLWEAVQGDFNEARSTGQIAFDAAVSMVPGVDQVCDVRDIIANCKAIAQAEEDSDNTWLYVSLGLTLIGLFPTLGSLVKGVLKLFFVFVRRYGLDHVTKAVDEGMSWVITYLRKREVQRYISDRHIDEVFKWLAEQVRVLKGKVTVAALLANFDRGIATMKALLGKVTWLPGDIGTRAQAKIDMVLAVRKKADAPLQKAFAPLQRVLDAIIHRLEMESLVYRHGVVDVNNIHFRGTLPQTRAVTLMRKTEPMPTWLSKGRDGKWPGMELEDGEIVVSKMKKQGWPDLPDNKIETFHKLAAAEIKGPAKLYRVTSPGNGAAGDFWMTEDVWKKIQNSPDPKAAWRKYCAVWPDWNANGQFTVLEIPPGERLKVWQGPAASQKKLDQPDFNAHLEGGWDQVWVKMEASQWDTTRYYMRGGGHGEKLHPPGLSREQWDALSPAKKRAYAPIRERINHPTVKGPLDTGWGTTDFDAQLRDAKIGLPALPGQLTN